MTLVTHQTGAEGKLVRKVYVEAGSEIARELYLALALDRADARSFAIIASTEGGMDIEEVAAKTPEKILTRARRPGGRASSATRSRKLALRRSGSTAAQSDAPRRVPRAASTGSSSRRTPRSSRSTRWSSPEQGELLALDGKLNFDDNALYRHPDVAALRDPDEEDPREREAKKIDLAYVGARRRHRLHGERRRPRDGDDGHDHSMRRAAGELPRRRRRRRRGEGRGGVQADPRATRT